MKILNSDDYIEKINSYEEQDWKPLLDLILRIEKVKKFGDCKEAKNQLEKGIIEMHQYVEHEIADQFRN